MPSPVRTFSMIWRDKKYLNWFKSTFQQMEEIFYFSAKSNRFFKKWAIIGLFFCLFSSFQTNITILMTNKCEKCPSSIWCLDLNSQPLEHKSPPITTRPGLPPSNCLLHAKASNAARLNGPSVSKELKSSRQWLWHSTVAFDTRGPGFESNHRQLLLNKFTVDCL